MTGHTEPAAILNSSPVLFLWSDVKGHEYSDPITK